MNKPLFDFLDKVEGREVGSSVKAIEKEISFRKNKSDGKELAQNFEQKRKEGICEVKRCRNIPSHSFKNPYQCEEHAFQVQLLHK